jgi:hypothetical protein
MGKRKSLDTAEQSRDISFVVVRCDTAPEKWFDGYYSTAATALVVAKYWRRVLGVSCFVMQAAADLPESAYQGKDLPVNISGGKE